VEALRGTGRGEDMETAILRGDGAATLVEALLPEARTSVLLVDTTESDARGLTGPETALLLGFGEGELGTFVLEMESELSFALGNFCEKLEGGSEDRLDWSKASRPVNPGIADVDARLDLTSLLLLGMTGV